MATSEPDTFFVALLRKDGQSVGHTIAFDLLSLDEERKASGKEEKNDEPALSEATTFAEVFASFTSTVTTYRNFLQFTLTIAPMLSNAIAERTIGEFVRARGNKREDLSSDLRVVYEMPINTLRQLTVHQDEILAALRGASFLPEVMLIGLVSAYDSFLAKLLKVIFLRHQKIILTSEKSIKFSELSTFQSIEDARDALIDREIESVLRESHHEHFRWMEEKFRVKLKVDLPAFPRFIEICERRNLLTHTGGVVSAKYIENCREQKLALPEVKIGTKLTVNSDYYSAAVDIVSEIGIKLCYVLWRKFAEEERDKADKAINEFCYHLIVSRNYRVAEAVLSFSTQVLKRKGSDYVRRMMLINQANAVRLQKRPGDANKLLDSEDWSAVSDEFAISVAAVRNDIDLVVTLMKKIGNQDRPNAEDYRTWPVFRGLRTEPRIVEAFQSVFGEPIVVAEKMELKLPDSEKVATPVLQIVTDTKH